MNAKAQLLRQQIRTTIARANNEALKLEDQAKGLLQFKALPDVRDFFLEEFDKWAATMPEAVAEKVPKKYRKTLIASLRLELKRMRNDFENRMNKIILDMQAERSFAKTAAAVDVDND